MKCPECRWYLVYSPRRGMVGGFEIWFWDAKCPNIHCKITHVKPIDAR